jgi:hypothetical protein
MMMGGLFDYVRENFFLDSRQGDFVPLKRGGVGDDDDGAFGPGPLILLYAVPETMLDDDELLDMVEDGMPSRQRGGVVVRRISGMIKEGEGDIDFDDRDDLLVLSVLEALERAMSERAPPTAPTTGSFVATADSILAERSFTGVVSPPSMAQQRQRSVGPCPVLYFSGVTNEEMMDTYRIIANEIYSETSGVHWPACAKVVPNAMGKSLGQVITEISGDHADAMRMSTAYGRMRQDVDGGS